MLKIGKYQDMRLKRFSTVGAYLVPMEDSEPEVLLPKKYLEEDFKEEQLIEVFIYKDSKDRLVATTEKPKAIVEETAYLEVVAVSEQGAFLNWGLEKDLFLPYKEQTCEVEEGKSYLVGIYLDKSERLCATMQVSKYLYESTHYETDQWTEGVVYSVHEEFGAFVAVENRYNGRIPAKEIHETYSIGQQVRVRITKIHEDGKLELSVREKSYLQRDEDSETILNALESNNGFLALCDSSDPEAIKATLKMSKKAFKRAVGKLFKEGSIVIEENGIRKI